MSTVSRRRLVCVMPVEAIIGKIAPADEKVSESNPGFKCFVGYQRGNGIFNRYQVKKNPRRKDYAQNELDLQTKFTKVVKATRQRLNDPDKSLQDMIAFSNQSKYKTLYSYVFNQEYQKQQ